MIKIIITAERMNDGETMAQRSLDWGATYTLGEISCALLELERAKQTLLKLSDTIKPIMQSFKPPSDKPI